MNTKHTPGPWATPGLNGADRVISATINGKRRTLAAVYGGDDCSISCDERNNNAAFIVRACNAHYGLLAALKLAQRIIANGGRCSGADLDQIDNAIAKATGNE